MNNKKKGAATTVFVRTEIVTWSKLFLVRALWDLR